MIYMAIYHLNNFSDLSCQYLANRAYERFFNSTYGFSAMPTIWRYTGFMAASVFRESTQQLHPDYEGVVYLDWDRISANGLDNVGGVASIVGHEEVHQLNYFGNEQGFEYWMNLPCTIDTPHNY